MTSLGAQVIYYQFYDIHFNLLWLMVNTAPLPVYKFLKESCYILSSHHELATLLGTLLTYSFSHSFLTSSQGALVLPPSGAAGLAMPDTGAYV